MGLHVDIYRSEDLAGCSNNGVSERVGIRGLCITNIDAPFEPSKEYPAAQLIVQKWQKYATVRCVPQELLDKGCGYMMGGSYVAACDSRFNQTIEKLTGHTFYGAVALHDRTENDDYIRSMD